MQGRDLNPQYNLERLISLRIYGTLGAQWPRQGRIVPPTHPGPCIDSFTASRNEFTRKVKPLIARLLKSIYFTFNPQVTCSYNRSVYSSENNKICALNEFIKN